MLRSLFREVVLAASLFVQEERAGHTPAQALVEVARRYRRALTEAEQDWWGREWPCGNGRMVRIMQVDRFERKYASFVEAHPPDSHLYVNQ